MYHEAKRQNNIKKIKLEVEVLSGCCGGYGGSYWTEVRHSVRSSSSVYNTADGQHLWFSSSSSTAAAAGSSGRRADGVFKDSARSLGGLPCAPADQTGFRTDGGFGGGGGGCFAGGAGGGYRGKSTVNIFIKN